MWKKDIGHTEICLLQIVIQHIFYGVTALKTLTVLTKTSSCGIPVDFAN